MCYVAAYLLASLGGKASPSVADIEKILSSVGIEAETDKINKIISELKSKHIEVLIAAGSKKLASVPSCGAVEVATVAAPADGAAASADKAAPAAPSGKKEEKKDEFEESDDDMGFGLVD